MSCVVWQSRRRQLYGGVWCEKAARCGDGIILAAARAASERWVKRNVIDIRRELQTVLRQIGHLFRERPGGERLHDQHQNRGKDCGMRQEGSSLRACLSRRI